MKTTLKLYLLLLATPTVFLFAAWGPFRPGIMGLVDRISDILGAILPLVLTLAVFYFLWALANYMLKAGEEQAEARQQMIWGVIILFVMVSVWGLVGILTSTLFG